jgi:hypothetical protein
MSAIRLTQDSAARMAVSWRGLRPDELPAAAKRFGAEIYAGLVEAGMSAAEARQTAGAAVASVMDELMELWRVPEAVH